MPVTNVAEWRERRDEIVRNMQRVMGQVLQRDQKPRAVWDEHETMLQAIAAGDGPRAEILARDHIMSAAEFMISGLQEKHPPKVR